MTTWMNAKPPETLHLECGAEVAHSVGTPVFNYYDHKPGTISRVATYADAPTMPVHAKDGDAAWWVTVRHEDGSTALLDQSRLCSIEYARARGWLS